MLSPQVVVPLFVMPLFPAGMVTLGRPRGHRLVAALGVFACVEYLVVVLFGSISLVNFLILSALYGPHAVLAGEIHIVHGRHLMEMSNGDKYDGLIFALWLAAEFMMLVSAFLVTRRLGKWLHAHVGLAKRLVARFCEAMTAAPADR